MTEKYKTLKQTESCLFDCFVQIQSFKALISAQKFFSLVSENIFSG